MKKVNKKDISAIRKKLFLLNRQRAKYIFSLVNDKTMVHGLPHEVFRRCGKKNCKCVRGELHGPYLALSVNKDGKQKIVMIKKADTSIVLEEAGRYREYKKTLSSIRKINKQIDELLEKVKSMTLRRYPWEQK